MVKIRFGSPSAEQQFHEHLIVFRQVFMDNYKSLCSYVYQYLKDKDVCEDIVQDTFVALWTRHDRLDYEQPLRPLVYKALYHRIVDYKRTHRNVILSIERMTDHPVDRLWNQMLSQPFDTINDVAEHLDAERINREVNEVLASLPPRYGEIYRMSRREGLGYRDIAERMGLSVKSVEKYMMKTLAALRKRLRKGNDLMMIFYVLFLL